MTEIRLLVAVATVNKFLAENIIKMKGKKDNRGCERCIDTLQEEKYFLCFLSSSHRSVYLINDRTNAVGYSGINLLNSICTFDYEVPLSCLYVKTART